MLHVGAGTCGSSSLQRWLTDHPVLTLRDGSTARYWCVLPDMTLSPEPGRTARRAGGRSPLPFDPRAAFVGRFRFAPDDPRWFDARQQLPAAPPQNRRGEEDALIGALIDGPVALAERYGDLADENARLRLAPGGAGAG